MPSADVSRKPDPITDAESSFSADDLGSSPRYTQIPNSKDLSDREVVHVLRSAPVGGNLAILPTKVLKPRIRHANGNDTERGDFPRAKKSFSNGPLPLDWRQKSSNRVEESRQCSLRSVPANKHPFATDRSSSERINGLLNKVTMRNFKSIGNQIADCASMSMENDKSNLQLVIKLILARARDEPNYSHTYASLCQWILNRISKLAIEAREGISSARGQLFRMYLLELCQLSFEESWLGRGARISDRAKAEGEAICDREGSGAIFSDLYYAQQKEKRQDIGLVRFIGELYKVKLLTERIILWCIETLSENFEDPIESEVEALTELLLTVGRDLDMGKTSDVIDDCFKRMHKLLLDSSTASRIKYLLLVSRISVQGYHFIYSYFPYRI